MALQIANKTSQPTENPENEKAF